MNLEFIRMLQSMVAVEKDPYFKSKKCVIGDRKSRRVDPSSGAAIPVVLKHPDCVVVVGTDEDFRAERRS